jgi:hypothetical protein
MRCKTTLATALAFVLTLAIAASAHAAVVTDSFTGTDGTLLQSHTGEVGASWSSHSNYPAAMRLQSGRLWGPEWSLYHASGIPATNEYDVKADLHVKSNAGAIGVVGRSSTSGADSLYMGRYNAGTARWELVKCISTGCEVLGFHSQTLTVGATYAVRLEIRNAAKKLFVDGVQRASSTDNAITQVGRTGIRSGPGVTTATTGYHLDNFSVDPPSADTNITSGPSGTTNDATPTFTFTSVPSGGTFQCRLDAGTTVGTWTACNSGHTYSTLSNGNYTFNVRATVGGITDSTPATRTFTVNTGCTLNLGALDVSNCTLLKSDNAAAADPEPLWGNIECELNSRHQQVTTGGDTHATGDGAAQGNTAFRRMTAIDGDDFAGERCELGINEHRSGFTPTFQLYREGERRVTFLSMRLPSNFPLSTTDWQVVMQMKQTQPSDNGNGTPVVELSASHGHWRLAQSGSILLTSTGRLLWDTPAANGIWTRFAFDVTYSQDETQGSIKVYVDLNNDGDALDTGEQSPTFTTYTLKREIAAAQSPDNDPLVEGDSVPSHLRTGIYHNPNIACPAPSGCSTEVDNVQVYAVP